jgi:hypothetical protein
MMSLPRSISLKACDDVADGLGLMLADYLLWFETDVLDVGEAELAPVDRTFGQVLEPKPGNWDGLIRQGFSACLLHLSVVETMMRWLKPRSPSLVGKRLPDAVKNESMSAFWIEFAGS